MECCIVNPVTHKLHKLLLSFKKKSESRLKASRDRNKEVFQNMKNVEECRFNKQLLFSWKTQTQRFQCDGQELHSFHKIYHIHGKRVKNRAYQVPTHLYYLVTRENRNRKIIQESTNPSKCQSMRSTYMEKNVRLVNRIQNSHCQYYGSTCRTFLQGLAQWLNTQDNTPFPSASIPFGQQFVPWLVHVQLSA